jgi:hypothetical protein
MSKSKQAKPIDFDNPRKELIRLFSELGRSHGTWKVFEDFLALSAISVSNSVDRVHAEQREKEYLSVIAGYPKDEQEQFPRIFAALVESCERQQGKPEDILGLVFHDLELHNKWQGQFFTPPNVSLMMAKMTFSGYDLAIERRGYIRVVEPCCGSGTLALAAASALVESGYNPQSQMLVEAMDIDINCVRMCYLQLALHGIPAIIRHGNTLTGTVWSEWATPMFVLGGWGQRLENERLVKSVLDILREPLVTAPLIAEKPLLSVPALPVVTELAEGTSGQFSLF